MADVPTVWPVVGFIYPSVWDANQRDSNWLAKIRSCNVQCSLYKNSKSPGEESATAYNFTNTTFQPISVVESKSRLNSKSYDYDQLRTPPTSADEKNNMCRRQLRFTKSIACGHLTLNGESTIDCRSIECHLSGAHLENCVTPQCRRYYERPERLITKEEPGRCIQCSNLT